MCGCEKSAPGPVVWDDVKAAEDAAAASAAA